MALKAQPTQTELLTQFNNAPDDARVSIDTVCVLWGNVAPCTVWRHVKTGLIPSPKKLTPNRTTWRVGDLRQALQTA